MIIRRWQEPVAMSHPFPLRVAKTMQLRHQGVEIRMLSYLVEQRRVLVDDRARMTNCLRAVLKQYYPQVLEWFDDIDTPIFCDFLTRWPTPLQAKRARENTQTTFFHEHNMRFERALEQ